MADDADRANDQADHALANILNNHPKFITMSLAECKECGEDIPARRQKLGGVSRCFDCQNEFEKRGR